MTETVLLVEDDPVLGPSLMQRLSLEGFKAVHAENLADARAALARSTPDFVLSDIRLPDGSGEDLMGDLQSRIGSIPVIFMTAHGDVDQAVRLVRGGARDYISKPFDTDVLMQRLREIIGTQSGIGADTFGLSSVMRDLRAMLDRVADIDLPVLLVGETGTGKEVAARHLHATGARADKPFEALNCAQIAPDLADSVLFGHEKGSFTGAHDRRAGYFETVADGTLFLDEIGEMPLELQLKLLRVLQDRTFRRLGARQDTLFEGRIVCATNRDLDAAVASGAFRQDLLYRINVVTLRVPPLRDRRDELPALMAHFKQEAAKRMGVAEPSMAADILDHAQSHDWPGNVRELRNRIERAVALAAGPELTVADLFPDTPKGKPVAVSASPMAEPMTLDEARQMAERTHIAAMLNRHDWRMKETAETLGISRSTLWERMQKLGLQRDEG